MQEHQVLLVSTFSLNVISELLITEPGTVTESRLFQFFLRVSVLLVEM